LLLVVVVLLLHKLQAVMAAAPMAVMDNK